MTIQLKHRKMIRPDFAEPAFGRKFANLMSMATKFRGLVGCVKHVKQSSELDHVIHDLLIGYMCPLLKTMKGTPDDNLR
jgi:hypothetical protein